MGSSEHSHRSDTSFRPSSSSTEETLEEEEKAKRMKYPLGVLSPPPKQEVKRLRFL
jgi:hypothetical protein